MALPNEKLLGGRNYNLHHEFTIEGLLKNAAASLSVPPLWFLNRIRIFVQMCVFGDLWIHYVRLLNMRLFKVCLKASRWRCSSNLGVCWARSSWSVICV